MEGLKLRLLPVQFEETERAFSSTAWVLPHELNAPKPRDALREREIPQEDLGLKNLPNILPFVEVLPKMSVTATGQEIRQIAESNADVLIVTGGRDDEIKLLTQFGKPILPQWDSWGYVWNIRYLPGKDNYVFIPFGSQEVKDVLRALYARKFLRQLRGVYFGDIPSHTVPNTFYNVEDMRGRFGVTLIRRPLCDYVATVQAIEEQLGNEIGAKWAQIYRVKDDRSCKLGWYGRIYLAIKQLLNKEKANALSIDCAALPSAEYVPCFAVSQLIDEGYVWSCEGDISALLAMAILIGISQGPAMMGNIFENTTHQDIEDNVIVLNHDVLPPSMVCKGCPIVLHDFHGTGKGLTGFAELEAGREVTVVSIDQAASKMWVFGGKIAWTENTVHCRVAVGIKVKSARRIAKEIGGHHPAMVYGNFIQALNLLGKLLGIEVVEL